MVTNMIECLPDEGDPQRIIAERIAWGVAFVGYAGTWYKMGNSESLIPSSSGADTVSKKGTIKSFVN